VKFVLWTARAAATLDGRLFTVLAALQGCAAVVTHRPLRPAAGRPTTIGPDSPIRWKTDRPQVLVMLPPWLHASHNRAKGECGSYS